MDISLATSSRVIVHKIGNKLRDEGYKLSEVESQCSEVLEELLLRHYLAPLTRQGGDFEFFHESDISLNAMKFYSDKIFYDNHNFIEFSQDLAKHLYSVSTHPNISSGELILVLFDIPSNTEGEAAMQALGVIRAEGKDDYLYVEDSGEYVSVVERTGISLRKIQRGALIFSTGEVKVLDNINQNTKYWIESFLKVVPKATPKAISNAAATLVRSFSSSISSPSKRIEFNESFSKKLEENDSLSIGDIKGVAHEYMGDNQINDFLRGAEVRSGLKIPDSTEIKASEMISTSKKLRKKLQITKGLDLVVSDPRVSIKALDTKETRKGLRLVVEIELDGDF